MSKWRCGIRAIDMDCKIAAILMKGCFRLCGSQGFSMKNNSFQESFRYAIAGLWYALRHERNLRLHFIAAAAVSLLGLVCGFTALEIALLLLVIGFVIFAEMINTAVEKMVDYVSPQWSANAKIAKDVAAGAVLISAAFAVLIGCVLFLRPTVIHRVWDMISSLW